MSLAIDYCKEIARELQQVAVYLPGTAVAPGDILKFKHGGLLGIKPLGEFATHGNLADFGINLETISEQPSGKDSYVYASKGSVNVSFEAEANAGDDKKGKLSVGFSKEGSVYLSAVDCLETRFRSIIGLEEKFDPYRDKLDWASFFIVISVTTAAKALIMQSSSSSASLEISGTVKNLVPGAAVAKDINADLGIKIARYKEASFIKDWSENVPVFMAVVRYRRKFLGNWDLNSKNSTLARSVTNAQENPYIIEVIDPGQLV